MALCRASFLWLAIFSCTRATLARCLARLLEPFFFLESLLCARASFLSDLARLLGFAMAFPSERAMRQRMPTSTPKTSMRPSGISGFGQSVHVSTQKYLPLGTRFTVARSR